MFSTITLQIKIHCLGTMLFSAHMFSSKKTFCSNQFQCIVTYTFDATMTLGKKCSTQRRERRLARAVIMMMPIIAKYALVLLTRSHPYLIPSTFN